MRRRGPTGEISFSFGERKHILSMVIIDVAANVGESKRKSLGRGFGKAGEGSLLPDTRLRDGDLGDGSREASWGWPLPCTYRWDGDTPAHGTGQNQEHPEES